MQTDTTDDTLTKIERILDHASKWASFVRFVVVGAVVSVLWVARTEWKAADHEHRLTAAEAAIKPVEAGLERVRGHLGITVVTPEPDSPARVVWTEEERRKEAAAQATH